MRFLVLLLAFVPLALNAQDLVFRAVTPCVIFDTRPAFGGTGVFTAEETRTFHIVGSTANFAAQGGTAGGCGVPGFANFKPLARAVFINYVAVEPQGAGSVKAWATDETEPAQGGIVNFQLLSPPMNNSNGVITELRKNAEGSDISVRVRSASAHVRGVILGYFVAAEPKLMQQRAAVLRWHAQSHGTGGLNPVALAFDGTHVWVVNATSNNVTKLRASDGVELGMFATGTAPRAIAFDGEHIWVVNSGSNNVTKMRAIDGSVVGTPSVGSSPQGIGFDGTNVWITNSGSNTVTKLRASDSQPFGTFSTGTTPLGVAFDGANVWIANFGGDNVSRLRAIDGSNQGTFPAGTGPTGVAFDRANIWITNSGSNNLTKLRASDGANLDTIGVGMYPSGIAFDGADMWVGNVVSQNVSRIRAYDGTNLGTFPATSGAPQGAVYDGASVWFANYFNNVVTRF